MTQKRPAHYWDISDVHLTKRIQRVGRPGHTRRHKHSRYHGCTYTQGFCLRLRNRTFIWYWRKA